LSNALSLSTPEASGVRVEHHVPTSSPVSTRPGRPARGRVNTLACTTLAAAWRASAPSSPSRSSSPLGPVVPSSARVASPPLRAVAPSLSPTHASMGLEAALEGDPGQLGVGALGSSLPYASPTPAPPPTSLGVSSGKTPFILCRLHLLLAKGRGACVAISLPWGCFGHHRTPVTLSWRSARHGVRPDGAATTDDDYMSKAMRRKAAVNLDSLGINSRFKKKFFLNATYFW
jgi:hypothetical protein